MSPSLPERPSIEHLKKEAKALLRAHKGSNAEACQHLRLLRRFTNATDAEILRAEVALHDAQFALALAYGFKSWLGLKAHVQSLEAARAEAEGDRVPADFDVVLESLLDPYAEEGDADRLYYVRPGDTDRDGFPQVLLEPAVREFRTIIDEAKGGYGGTDGFLAAALVCARTAGWTDLTLDEMAALSGASALFAYDPSSNYPKYVNRHIRMDQRIAEATGFGLEWLPTGDAEDLWRVIKESIDSSRPVMGEYAEMVVFTGYQDAHHKAGREVFALEWHIPGTARGWLTWEVFERKYDRFAGALRTVARHSERVEVAPDREVALRVLRDIVDWSISPPESVRTGLAARNVTRPAFGLAGIEAYADDIADVEDKPGDYFFCGWAASHVINPQRKFRYSTAVYLEHLAGTETFPDRVNRHLLEAAKDYGAACLGWEELQQQLGGPGPKEAWSKRERRLAGAAAVRKALEHEKAGIQHIRRTLVASE